MNGRIYDPLMGRFMSADPFIQSPFERYAAHASVGCVSSVASGGHYSQGAAAAVLGKWVTNSTSNWGAGIAQGTAAAVAGGVGSVIAGGKFENGAKTAAFGYLFNQAMSERGKQERASRIRQNERLAEFLRVDTTQTSNDGKSSPAEASVNFLQALLPASTAPLVRDPIGGTSDAQIDYSLSVNEVRRIGITFSIQTPFNGTAGGYSAKFFTNMMVKGVITDTSEFVSTPKK